MDLKQKYFNNFLTILEPSENLVSGNQLFRWYINYCHNELNIHGDKWVYTNRQQFINKMRKITNKFENFNDDTNRSIGWSLNINKSF